MNTLRFLAALAYATAIDALRVRWSRLRAAILEAERARLQAIAEELARGVSVRETVHPWNWCPTCKQPVDVGECFDGSEARCWGCRTVYVCEALTDGTWALCEREPEDDDGDNPPPACTDDDHAIFANRGHLRCGVCDAALTPVVHLRFLCSLDHACGIEPICINGVGPRNSTQVRNVTCRECLAAIGHPDAKPLPAVHYGPEGRPVCGAATWVGLTAVPRLVEGCEECEAMAMTGAEVA